MRKRRVLYLLLAGGLVAVLGGCMGSKATVQGAGVLKQSSGASKVGRGASTVDADLAATELVANGAEVKAAAAVAVGDSAHLSIVDMHYGALRGLGWVSAENGSERSYTVSVASAVGDLSITLDSNASIEFADAPLVANQLIAYLGDDGFYYSVGIDAMAGAVINLKSPLKSDISAGAKVFNFYANESHPNKYGYRAIVDYADRSLKYSAREVSREILVALGGATISTNGANDKNNPGSVSVVNKNVVTNTGGYVEGMTSSFVPRVSGAHVMRLKMNTLGNDVKVTWSVGGYSDSLTINNNGPEVVEFPFFVYSDTSSIAFTVTGSLATESYLINEVVEFLKVEGSRAGLNRGKHVLLGDSWFEQMGAVGSGDLWYEDRFPQATFINSGVGGNTASQLSGRFDVDVAAHNPDFVWLMVGTNDIYGAVAVDLFSYYINKLKAECAAIGAHLILYTGYVGSADLSAARFDLSREYAQEAFYSDREINQTVVNRQVVTFPATVVAAGTELVLADLGRYTGTNFRVLESYFTHAITVKEKTTIAAGGTSIGTLAASLVTADANLPHTAGRFLQFSHDNVTGSPVTVSGYAVIQNEAAY